MGPEVSTLDTSASLTMMFFENINVLNIIKKSLTISFVFALSLKLYWDKSHKLRPPPQKMTIFFWGGATFLDFKMI